eukprot:TRINITY_DN12291_c0_g1_i1.p1 TRINITY_DN12291_c0_g1~~TRINITY_DN12291_c0_g1_i1.p1  ORF type:complete len:773 (-),score=223.17 TRINITY_DN12291_c0_g1_i1:312-2519(-)
MLRSLVGSEMCIRDRVSTQSTGARTAEMSTAGWGLRHLAPYLRHFRPRAAHPALIQLCKATTVRMFSSTRSSERRGRQTSGSISNQLETLAEEEGDTAAYNQLLHSCTRRGDIAGVRRVVSQMDARAVRKDASTYTSLIKALFRSGDLQEAERRFHEALEDPRVARSVPVYNAMLNGLTADVDRVFSVWWKMRETGLKPSEYTLCAIIKAVSRSKDGARLAHVWDEVSNAGALPGPMAHSALVVAYAQCNELQLGIRVMEVMEGSGLLEDSHHARIAFNALLAALGPEDPLTKPRVQKLLGMMEAAEIEADDVTFHSLMKNSSSEYIAILLEAMRENAVPVSTESVNLLLKARLQEVPENLEHHRRQVMQDLKEFSLVPDTFTYGLLIKGAAACADPELGFSLVREMEDKGLQLSHTVITSLIWACSPRSSVVQLDLEMQERSMDAKKLLKARLNRVRDIMKAAGLQHNVITATAMIAAFGKGGMSNAASGLFRQLETMSVQPNVRTYNKLIHATIFGRYYLTWLIDLVNGMEAKGVKPNLATFNKLILNCSEANQLELAFSVRNMLEAHGLKPSSRTWVNLVQAAIDNGEWREGLQLVEAMEQSGFKSYPAYNLLIQAASQQGSAHEVLSMSHDMRTKGFTFNGHSVQFPVKAYLRTKQPKKALSLLNKVLRTESAANTQSRRFLMARWYDLVRDQIRDPQSARQCEDNAAALRKMYAGHKTAQGQLGHMLKAS